MCTRPGPARPGPGFVRLFSPTFCWVVVWVMYWIFPSSMDGSYMFVRTRLLVFIKWNEFSPFFLYIFILSFSFFVSSIKFSVFAISLQDIATTAVCCMRFWLICTRKKDAYIRWDFPLERRYTIYIHPPIHSSVYPFIHTPYYVIVHYFCGYESRLYFILCYDDVKFRIINTFILKLAFIENNEYV